MATAEECERALRALAARLDRLRADGEDRGRLDRTLSCTVRDLAVVFTGRLDAGRLVEIGRSARAEAQIRLELDSDDLLRLVDGTLPVGAAWVSGRIRVSAGVRDLVRLKSIF